MDNKDNYFKSEEFKDILHRYEEAENSGRHEYLGSDELTDIAEYYYNLGRNKESRFSWSVIWLTYIFAFSTSWSSIRAMRPLKTRGMAAPGCRPMA